MWLQTYVKVSFNSSPHCCWSYFSDFQFRVDQLYSKLCSNDPLQLSLFTLQLSLFALTLWTSASHRLLLVEILISIFSFACLAETLFRSSVSQSYLRSKLCIDSFISPFLFIFSSSFSCKRLTGLWRSKKLLSWSSLSRLDPCKTLSSPRALSVCLCVFFLLISLSFSVFLSIFSSMHCVLIRDLRCVEPFKCTVDSYFWLKELNCRSVQLTVLSTPCLCSSNLERILLHVSVLFRWAEHKNPHTGTVESLATSRAQLSAQMIAYRASRAFRRKADSAWDEEWEQEAVARCYFRRNECLSERGRFGLGLGRKKGADGRRVKSRRRVM